MGALRQIYGNRAILPTTHVLARGLINEGKISFAANDVDDLWEAQYKQRTVRIGALRISSIADQDSVEKAISRHNSICVG